MPNPSKNGCPTLNIERRWRRRQKNGTRQTLTIDADVSMTMIAVETEIGDCIMITETGVKIETDPGKMIAAGIESAVEAGAGPEARIEAMEPGAVVAEEAEAER